MNKQRKKKKGLTLLELIIVLGLMGIVTSLIFSFVNTTQKKSKELEIRQELQHDGTMITESMMKNILQTSGIESISPITATKGESGLSEIIFSLDVLGKALNVNNIDKVKYIVEGKEFKIKVHEVTETPAIVGGVGVWRDLQTLTGNIKEIQVKNKNLNNLWFEENGLPKPIAPSTSTVEVATKDEKSINLKVILDFPYYNKTIEHEHTIELSLRNAK